MGSFNEPKGAGWSEKGGGFEFMVFIFLFFDLSTIKKKWLILLIMNGGSIMLKKLEQYR